jgi:hypothetical protein
MMVQLGGDSRRKRVRGAEFLGWQRGDCGELEVRRDHQAKGGVNLLARNHAVRPNPRLSHIHLYNHRHLLCEPKTSGRD